MYVLHCIFDFSFPGPLYNLYYIQFGFKVKVCPYLSIPFLSFVCSVSLLCFLFIYPYMYIEPGFW